MRIHTRLTLVGLALAVAAIAGTAFGASGGGSPAWAQGNTWIVNDDALPAAYGCATPTFTTRDLNVAIGDPRVVDGDTLIVCEGQYEAGQVVLIGKSLTVRGRAEADRGAIVVRGPGDAVLVRARATVGHMKIAPTLIPAGEPFQQGVGIQFWLGADGSTVDDVEVSGFRAGIKDAFIGTTGTSGTVIEASRIHHNGTGVSLIAGGSDNVIRGNWIQDNTRYGIELDGEDASLVEGNLLSGNALGQVRIAGQTSVQLFRNEIGEPNGVKLESVPADSQVVIGGSSPNANAFVGSPAAGAVFLSLTCDSAATVDAIYNYWSGLASRAAIQSFILDQEGAADCPGAVLFEPWTAEPPPLSGAGAVPAAGAHGPASRSWPWRPLVAASAGLALAALLLGWRWRPIVQRDSAAK